MLPVRPVVIKGLEVKFQEWEKLREIIQRYSGVRFGYMKANLITGFSGGNWHDKFTPGGPG